MSKSILRNAKGERNWQRCVVCENNRRGLAVSRNVVQGKIHIGLATNVFMFFSVLMICVGAYVYQVNGIATEGFAEKELQDQIQDLKKQSEQLKIKEVELKSMYNIEKSAEELNLESAPGLSYVEMHGPVAMK